MTLMLIPGSAEGYHVGCALL